MIALERKEDGWAATLGVAQPFRCDASSPIDQCSDIAPEHLAHLQCSTLHQVPSFRSCSRGVTATDGHAEAPDSARARHSVQINAPVSVTLIGIRITAIWF